MFCLMDVSGSMTEHMKDLAKRFYVLLYIFLKRRYKHVDVVFIRHTHQASEVDEDTFFHSPGDRRHRGLDRARGDAARRRRALPARRLEHLRGPGVGRRQHLLRQRPDGRAADATPSCRSASTTPIWKSGARARASRPASSAATAICGRPIASGPRAARRWRCARSNHRRDIYPVFRELFAQEGRGAEADGMNDQRRCNGPNAAVRRRRLGIRHHPARL